MNHNVTDRNHSVSRLHSLPSKPAPTPAAPAPSPSIPRPIAPSSSTLSFSPRRVTPTTTSQPMPSPISAPVQPSVLPSPRASHPAPYLSAKPFLSLEDRLKSFNDSFMNEYPLERAKLQKLHQTNVSLLESSENLSTDMLAFKLKLAANLCGDAKFKDFKLKIEGEVERGIEGVYAEKAILYFYQELEKHVISNQLTSEFDSLLDDYAMLYFSTLLRTAIFEAMPDSEELEKIAERTLASQLQEVHSGKRPSLCWSMGYNGHFTALRAEHVEVKGESFMRVSQFNLGNGIQLSAHKGDLVAHELRLGEMVGEKIFWFKDNPQQKIEFFSKQLRICWKSDAAAYIGFLKRYAPSAEKQEAVSTFVYTEKQKMRDCSSKSQWALTKELFKRKELIFHFEQFKIETMKKALRELEEGRKTGQFRKVHDLNNIISIIQSAVFDLEVAYLKTTFVLLQNNPELTDHLFDKTEEALALTHHLPVSALDDLEFLVRFVSHPMISRTLIEARENNKTFVMPNHRLLWFLILLNDPKNEQARKKVLESFQSNALVTEYVLTTVMTTSIDNGADDLKIQHIVTQLLKMRETFEELKDPKKVDPKNTKEVDKRVNSIQNTLRNLTDKFQSEYLDTVATSPQINERFLLNTFFEETTDSLKFSSQVLDNFISPPHLKNLMIHPAVKALFIEAREKNKKILIPDNSPVWVYIFMIDPENEEALNHIFKDCNRTFLLEDIIPHLVENDLNPRLVKALNRILEKARDAEDLGFPYTCRSVLKKKFTNYVLKEQLVFDLEFINKYFSSHRGYIVSDREDLLGNPDVCVKYVEALLTTTAQPQENVAHLLKQFIDSKDLIKHIGVFKSFALLLRLHAHFERGKNSALSSLCEEGMALLLPRMSFLPQRHHAEVFEVDDAFFSQILSTYDHLEKKKKLKAIDLRQWPRLTYRSLELMDKRKIVYEMEAIMVSSIESKNAKKRKRALAKLYSLNYGAGLDLLLRIWNYSVQNNKQSAFSKICPEVEYDYWDQFRPKYAVHNRPELLTIICRNFSQHSPSDLRHNPDFPKDFLELLQNFCSTFIEEIGSGRMVEEYERGGDTPRLVSPGQIIVSKILADGFFNAEGKISERWDLFMQNWLTHEERLCLLNAVTESLSSK